MIDDTLKESLSLVGIVKIQKPLLTAINHVSHNCIPECFTNN